jgi:hypothetical protein
MIAVAVLALVLVAFTWLLHISTAMDDFYGPRGKLAIEAQIGSEISTGLDSLQQSLFVEPETRFRLALSLNEDLGARLARHGWHTDQASSEILIGLADSLAGQRRYREAAEELEHSATFERKMGNTARERGLLARADAIFKMAPQAP